MLSRRRLLPHASERRSGERQGCAALRLGACTEDAAVSLVDGHVVDACLAASHVSVVVELPLLVAVAAPPLSRRIPALVLKANGDPIVAERPEVLSKRVVELAIPLAAQEVHNRWTAGRELVSIAPLRVLRVGAGDALRLPRVPRVLRRLNLLAGGLLGKWRHGRSHRQHLTDRSRAKTRTSGPALHGR